MPIDINLDENSEGKVLSTEDIIYQILEDEEIGDENFASVDILKQPIYKIMTGSKTYLTNLLGIQKSSPKLCGLINQICNNPNSSRYDYYVYGYSNYSGLLKAGYLSQVTTPVILNKLREIIINAKLTDYRLVMRTDSNTCDFKVISKKSQKADNTHVVFKYLNIMTDSNGIVVKKPEEYVIDTNLLSNRSIATTKPGFTQFSNNSCSDRLKSLLNRLD
jgi:hypothetical protein